MAFKKLHVSTSFSVEEYHAINALLHDCLASSRAVKSNDNFDPVACYAAEDMIFHATFLGEHDTAAKFFVGYVAV